MHPAPSVLANLTLGYQLVWNRQRQPAGVLLFAEPISHAKVGGAHLLATLAQHWLEYSPQLILLVQSADLLADVLAHATPGSPWIGVENRLSTDPQVAAQSSLAHARGVHLVWRGDAGPRPSPPTAACFSRQLASLTAGEALLALHAALQIKPNPSGQPQRLATSPVRAEQLYEAVASRTLADHCLDQQHAWGVAGWPTEDVLYAYRELPVQPSHQVLVRLVDATDADLALDRIENILTQDPVLVVRFLRYANSAALGRRTGIDALRHALMVLGLSTFRRWLLEQLPLASHDTDLQPVRSAMGVRARLMELLLDAGAEDKLRSEVQLCGLLSQIDLVLGEPLATALQRFPVSERITGAILGHSGPYAPLLEIATALEYPNMRSMPDLCDRRQFDIGDVNRALLHVLAHA